MEFSYPRTVEEAAESLGKPGSVAVAGGTAFTHPPKADLLVDLTRLPLSYVEYSGPEIRIGATTTISALEKSPVAASVASGIIPAACRELGDTPLRNMITVGGNVACMHFWANLPPVLLALEAKLKISGKKERVIPIEEFFSSNLSPGEFISEVIIPKEQNRGKGAFLKFSRTKNDYSLITVAAYAETKGGNFSSIRLAVSGLSRVVRLRGLEEELKGKKPTPELLDKAVSKAVTEVKLLKSFIFTEDYKREVLGALLKRAIAEVAK